MKSILKYNLFSFISKKTYKLIYKLLIQDKSKLVVYKIAIMLIKSRNFIIFNEGHDLKSKSYYIK